MSILCIVYFYGRFYIHASQLAMGLTKKLCRFTNDKYKYMFIDNCSVQSALIQSCTRVWSSVFITTLTSCKNDTRSNPGNRRHTQTKRLLIRFSLPMTGRTEAVFLVVCDPSMNEREQPRKVYAQISMGLGCSQLVHRRVTQIKNTASEQLAHVLAKKQTLFCQCSLALCEEERTVPRATYVMPKSISLF